MNRHADFLPGEAGFLLGLLQEVGGLKEFFVLFFSSVEAFYIMCVCRDHSCEKNLNVSAYVLCSDILSQFNSISLY